MDPNSRRIVRISLFIIALLVLGALAACVSIGSSASAAAEHKTTEPDREDEPPIEKLRENPKEGGEGFNVGHLMEHVLGADKIDLFDSFGPDAIPLPFGMHKFVLLELIAAFLILLFYVPLSMRAASGAPPHGAFGNAFEVLLTFVRNDIAKPTMGEDADKFVPFLWTLFLFILFNNLLGMFPFLGSATASIYVTFALALIVFFAIHGSAIVKMSRGGHAHDHDHDHTGDHDHEPANHGHHADAPSKPNIMQGFKNYMHSMWPQLDLPFPFGPIIKPLVFVLEIIGVLVRNLVLAIRLFANMFAGHMVLVTILFFIVMAKDAPVLLWGTVTVSSVIGIVALSLLELFVAFLQAFIFTFLASLFMGMALNPQH